MLLVKKELPRKHLGVVRMAEEPGAISGTVDQDFDATSLICPYWACPQDMFGKLQFIIWMPTDLSPQPLENRILCFLVDMSR